MGTSTSSKKESNKQLENNIISISSIYNKTQNNRKEKLKEKENNHMEHYIKKTYISFPFQNKTSHSSNSNNNQITKSSENLQKNLLINLENDME